jgi:hypothetical protein
MLSKECDVREENCSSIRKCKEWMPPIGQQGGRSKMKQVSEPAV